MIKIDMEMPDYCKECPFYSGYRNGTCLADPWDNIYFGNVNIEYERAARCPIQEVEEDE